MDAKKAYEILRNYKTEHEKDMSPDEREAFDMALRDMGSLARLEASSERYTTVQGHNSEGDPLVVSVRK